MLRTAAHPDKRGKTMLAKRWADMIAIAGSVALSSGNIGTCMFGRYENMLPCEATPTSCYEMGSSAFSRICDASCRHEATQVSWQLTLAGV